MTEKLVDFDPPRLMTFHIENEMMYNSTMVRFESREGSTLITARSVIRGRGVFWSSLVPLMKQMIEEKNKNDYEALKHIIDGTR